MESRHLLFALQPLLLLQGQQQVSCSPNKSRTQAGKRRLLLPAAVNVSPQSRGRQPASRQAVEAPPLLTIH